MDNNNCINSESKVLLVCIYNLSGNIITHDILYKYFSPFGKITKILIFEKAKVWKSFVELDSIEAACRAKEILQNKTIFEDGSKLNIYFAKFSTLILEENKNSGIGNYKILRFLDYTVLPENKKKNNFMNQFLNKNTLDKRVIFSEKFISTDYNKKKNFPEKKSKTEKFVMESRFGESLAIIDNFLDNIFQKDENTVDSTTKASRESSEEKNNNDNNKKFENYINPIFLLENQKSKVLYVRNIDLRKIDSQMIFNLFCNYGNICEIIILYSKSAVLIEFEKIFYATQAKDYLKGRKPIETDHEESYTPDPKKNRFTLNNVVAINPPSDILHVSNLSPDALDKKLLFNLFKPYGKILAIE